MPGDRCTHGAGRPCPWPGCERGVAGARLVVCGTDGAKYFARAIDVTAAGELVLAWVELAAMVNERAVA